MTRAEWDRRFPDREPIAVEIETNGVVFERNITHNLGSMANAAGLYFQLWYPDKIGITQASQLIEPLRAGLERLKATPDEFQRFNPENGWGTYEGLIDFAQAYLEACETYPEAVISVSR